MINGVLDTGVQRARTICVHCSQERRVDFGGARDDKLQKAWDDLRKLFGIVHLQCMPPADNHNRIGCVHRCSNSRFVGNPFKVGDRVITKVQGVEVDAIVTKLWQNELQVRTPDKELRWRTMYTVWYPGGSPLTRPVKETAEAKAGTEAPANKPIIPNGKNGAAKPKSVRRTRSRKRR